jgi:predicted ATPase with chaperone activity
VERRPFVPPVPWKIKDTGLSDTLLEQLTCNILYTRGELTGRVIADALGLSFSVIEPLLSDLKARLIVDLKSSLGYGLISSVFALSEAGRVRAREQSGSTQYTGPAPVPLAQYVAAVKAQMPPKGWLNRETLSRAYRHMVTGPEVFSQIGPAINSGKSILIYGNPGNGKTYMAEALLSLDSVDVFIPYAIEHNGTIVQVYDPLHHRAVEGQDESGSLFSLERSFDSRWVRCKRPFIVSGGELSIEMLELSFNAGTKVYDAPFHTKANNGMYLIDDFGRQRVTPTELLNRWIVPMESRVDHLTLPTGGKLGIPFESFLIFSTNLNPSDLGDEAFLRRIQYKMFVRNPTAEEFRDIFVRFCAAKGLDCPNGLVDRFIRKHYEESKRPFRRCHARDVISHAIDLMDFEERPHLLTEDLLDRAFVTCFAEEETRD